MSTNAVKLCDQTGDQTPVCVDNDWPQHTLQAFAAVPWTQNAHMCGGSAVGRWTCDL